MISGPSLDTYHAVFITQRRLLRRDADKTTEKFEYMHDLSFLQNYVEWTQK